MHVFVYMYTHIYCIIYTYIHITILFRYLEKRISPLDDDLGVLSDEVLLAEDEERAVVGGAEAGKTDVGGALGHITEGRVLSAQAPVIPTTVSRQICHPGKRRIHHSIIIKN